MQFIKWLINFIFWLQAFIAPVILAGIIGLIIAPSVQIFIILLAAGAIVGIVVAEYIRRKYGLSVFFGRLYGPNEMDRPKNDSDRN